jgi:hypothetical protein
MTVARPHQARLVEVAKEAGMDVGITRGNQIVLYLTWHGQPERINEIAVRNYGESAEAGAHILTKWIETRPKKEFA